MPDPIQMAPIPRASEYLYGRTAEEIKKNFDKLPMELQIQIQERAAADVESFDEFKSGNPDRAALRERADQMDKEFSDFLGSIGAFAIRGEPTGSSEEKPRFAEVGEAGSLSPEEEKKRHHGEVGWPRKFPQYFERRDDGLWYWRTDPKSASADFSEEDKENTLDAIRSSLELSRQQEPARQRRETAAADALAADPASPGEILERATRQGSLDVYDINGDGTVTREEHDLMQKIHREGGRNFWPGDRGGGDLPEGLTEKLGRPSLGPSHPSGTRYPSAGKVMVRVPPQLYGKHGLSNEPVQMLTPEQAEQIPKWKSEAAQSDALGAAEERGTKEAVIGPEKFNRGDVSKPQYRVVPERVISGPISNEEEVTGGPILPLRPIQLFKGPQEE